MICAQPFVYGRTRTIDYRWLQKPAIPLRVGFFGDALESCSPSLRKGQKAYFASIDDGGCILFVMLNLKGAEDHRGRRISFVLGYTVGIEHGRDFAYYLPALLDSCGSLFSKYISHVLQSVESDTPVAIGPFVLIPPVPPFFKPDEINDSSIGNGTDGGLAKPISQTSSLGEAAETAPEFGNQLTDEWLNKTAASIRSSVNTPRVVCSFDVTSLGPIFEEGTGEALATGFAGTTPPGLGSSQPQGFLHEPEESASLEQMRRFVESNGEPKSISNSHTTTKGDDNPRHFEQRQQHSKIPQERVPSAQPMFRFFDICNIFPSKKILPPDSPKEK
jgi:hypothetical protein